jgi:2-oxoacid:acceptor oxidoreductase gamma subunit (pyruvate/2-ketoisovalerate family)
VKIVLAGFSMSSSLSAPRAIRQHTRTVGALEGLSLPLELRVHGRGGQGGVTCAKLIAALYAQLGFYVQSFGDYGGERSGAPIQAFARVDRMPISNRNKVYEPDHLLVLDEGLVGVNVLSGVAPGAVLLLNTTAKLESFREQYANYRLGVIGATAIAREHGIGTSSVVIINTTIVGAYAGLLGLTMSSLEQSFISLGLEDDLDAARDAYERVEVQEPLYAAAGIETRKPADGTPPGVLPLTEHCQDVRLTLKTGTWSSQAPIYREHKAPCNEACPAGNDVVGFIQALKKQGPEAAAAVLLRTQALPSVCGRVCPAPCMEMCNRTAYDGAVNIRSLERWIADHSEGIPTSETADVVRRVAVVGGGPAGLSAAYQLALRGHHVTIFEAQSSLGGVLFNGIPAFRLPRDVLERDVARIQSLGVEVKCGQRLDRSELARLEQEYDAVIVGIGFGRAMKLSAEGEQLSGVEQGLDFLARINKEPVAIEGNVMVIGGGNTAIDCARSALRCGADSVSLAYRRGLDEMPAIVAEIEEALGEGVRIMPHRQPIAFSGENSVMGVMLAEVEPGPPDETGRCRPIVTNRTSNQACDKVLLALGQNTGIDILPEAWQLRDGRAWQDAHPLSVWFAGDCATGEGTVTHAIGNGRRIARALLASLNGEEPVTKQAADGSVTNPSHVRFSHFTVVPAYRDRHLRVASSLDNFEELNLGLTGPEEADRCFSCGHCTQCDTCLMYCPDGIIQRMGGNYLVLEDYCKGCGMCVAECPRYAMEMTEKNQYGMQA